MFSSEIMEFELSLKLPSLFIICEPVVFKAGKVVVIIVYLVKTTGFVSLIVVSGSSIHLMAKFRSAEP